MILPQLWSVGAKGSSAPDSSSAVHCLGVGSGPSHGTYSALCKGSIIIIIIIIISCHTCSSLLQFRESLKFLMGWFIICFRVSILSWCSHSNQCAQTDWKKQPAIFNELVSLTVMYTRRIHDQDGGRMMLVLEPLNAFLDGFVEK